MTVLCIVQARFGSSRLPGKVLQSIGELNMLERVLSRLQRSETIDEIVVATTVAPADSAVEAAAIAAGVKVVRGSEFDVLDRFHQALLGFPSSHIVVRVTADCPFIDPEVIDLVVRRLEESGSDFVANRLPPPYPRTYPVGLDVEVCTAAALERAWRDAVLPYHREHVMPFLYENRDSFAIEVLQLETDLSGYRWTVDTPEDLEAARELAKLAGPEPFGWRHVLATAVENPHIANINADASQKDVSHVDERWL